MKLSFKFLQTGGVPLTNDLMSLLEESYGIFEVLADLAGNLTILAGCDPVAPNSTTLNPGIVAIEGKLYYFEGGVQSSTVFINKEEIQKVFQDQQTKTLIEVRTVRFGNSVAPNLYDWADFVRLKPLKEMQDFATQQQIAALQADIEILKLKTAPVINGGVVWAFFRPVAEIPAGWKECTNLRGKTIVGRDPNDADFAQVGLTSGAKTKKILKSHLPNEGVKIYQLKSTSNNWRASGGSGTPMTNIAPVAYNNQYEYSEERTTAPLGNGADFNVMNPFRIANYIEPNFQ